MEKGLLALVALLSLASLGQSKKDGETAEEIVKKMAAKYSACSTYQDSGVVETTFLRTNGKRITRTPFRLQFSRPNKLRFEWTLEFIEKTRHVVWCDGHDTYTYWEPDRYEKNRALSLGIAGATGVSDGSAHTVPRLLMEREVSGFALAQLVNLSILKEAPFEGVECFVIRGEHPVLKDHVPELWIGKKDSLLRKVRTQTKLKDFSTVAEEIHRDIKLDEKIDDKVFDFKPPEGVKLKEGEG